ncbi:UvrD-helicase domain-containing protein [Robertmurraya massiliosenegalensis]|uniref:UvrD-helicase domain-containing protein n=1 Tax=Robertmurraya massiliosenegalensis TaxID=1287657 RepID=UPI000301E6CB|nr:UvrD-helicase domain-containing protein [Robertmurraya massiliosenegalensis]
MHELQLEKDYLRKVCFALDTSLRDLEIEYSNYSPYVYAVGDMYNDWDFEIKKTNALRAKQTFPAKIQRLKTLKNSPYFGKIYIEDENGKQQFYIGEEDIHLENRNLVISWRTEYGDLFYKKLPIVVLNSGNTVKLFKIRNFNIRNGQLLDYNDYEIMHIDNVESDLLKAYTKYISSDFLQNQLVNRNAQKLKPVFQTIDQLQNEIIRMPINQNVIVQGVSGSGKTTMGLQRLSYVIYQIEKNKGQSKILAICPNNLFLDYIQDLVPNLNLNNVVFASVQDLFSHFLPKDLKIAKAKIRDDLTYHFLHALDENKRTIYANWFKYKGSKEYANLLETHVQNIKQNLFNKDLTNIHPLLSRSLMLNIYDRLKHVPYNIMVTRAISYIEQILEVKDKQRLNNVLPLIKQEFLKKKVNVEIVYRDFLKNGELFKTVEFAELNRKQNQWYEEDIPALIYLSHLLENVNVKDSDFNHIFVDEAQDLTYIQYILLKKIYEGASFTIVGDLNQQIFLQRGISSWDSITPIFKCKLLYLEYNYRSSKEIMDLATSCLIDPLYTGSGVLETGVKPVQLLFNNRNIKFEKINWKKIYHEYIEKWLQKNESTAIITNSIEDSENIERFLNAIGVMETNVISTTESLLDHSKITIISALQVKGLEFNNVIVYNPSERDYPVNDYYSKLLYMVFTRALYNIVIVAVDSPSKLLLKADIEYLFKNRRI